jgi:formate dehydrogenase iron-sulfur subunit
MDRRNFLKLVGSTAVTSIVVDSIASPAAIPQAENPDRLGVLTDTTLCIGLNCRRCEIACAKEQNLPPLEKQPEDETVFHEIRSMSAKQFTVVNRFPQHLNADERPVYVKKQCMHCEEPACASACFVKAFEKTKEGPVIYHADLCVGCRYCMVACPFEVPAYEYNEPLTPRVRKCTMCYATRSGKGLAPACVEACPNEVMVFGKRSELLKLAAERIASRPERYVNHIYGEHEVGGTSWLILSGVPFEQIDLNMNLGTTPCPAYTLNYLSAAPLVMSMWPVFFAGLYMFTKRRDELIKMEKPRQENKT